MLHDRSLYRLQRAERADGVERWPAVLTHNVNLLKSKVQPKGKTGRADIALILIHKLYGIERDLKDTNDEVRKISCRERSLPTLTQLKTG